MYKLTNIQLEYEMIRDSPPSRKEIEKYGARETLAEQATNVYTSGKKFAYDHVTRDKVHPFKKQTGTRLNITPKDGQ